MKSKKDTFKKWIKDMDKRQAEQRKLEKESRDDTIRTFKLNRKRGGGIGY